MTNEEHAAELYQTAADAALDFQMAIMFHDTVGANKAAHVGLTACIELADLIRSGVEYETSDSPEERQRFLDEYPAGSTAESLIAENNRAQA